MAEQLTFEDAQRQRDAVLDLIFNDPRNEPDRREIARLIIVVGRANPDGLVSSNDIRDSLPRWVRPQVIGPTFSKLASKEYGLLAPTGRYVKSTDRKSRNIGKPVPVWQLTEKARRGQVAA